MVLMKYFCFCIPVRLGVIITSIIGIVQNSLILTVTLYYSAEDVSRVFDGLRDKSKDNGYVTQAKEVYEILIDHVKDYSTEFRALFIMISTGCIISSVLNIIAAITKFRWLSIFYILVGFIEISIVLTIHVNFMLFMKKKWNLGLLIATSCAGGFFMLFLLYLWGVTVAMFQIIGIVNSKDYQERLLALNQPVIAPKPKRNFAAIAHQISRDQSEEMLARDFYGVYKKTIRRI